MLVENVKSKCQLCVDLHGQLNPESLVQTNSSKLAWAIVNLRTKMIIILMMMVMMVMMMRMKQPTSLLVPAWPARLAMLTTWPPLLAIMSGRKAFCGQNDFYSANDYQWLILIVVSIMPKDDDWKSDRHFAKIALMVQKWASTFTSKVFTILMNVEK